MNKLLTVISYVILLFLSILILPFVIGGFIIWFILSKTKSRKLKYLFCIPIILLTLLFGSDWIIALNTPSTTTTDIIKKNVPTVNILVPTIKLTEQVTSTPTLVLTQIITPISTIIPPYASKKATYNVIKVIDGDTIIIDMNSKNETVRLIGIDSPETMDPRKPVQCFGKEASDKAKEILSGKNVILEADSTQGDKDKYNRLLRYVFHENGINVNKLMINKGYAFEYTYQSNPYKYQKEFIQAEDEARTNKLGLWSDNACVSPTQKPTLIPNMGNDKYVCSCSKTCGEMISCKEAYFQLNDCGCNARDGDGDGVPCESLCN